ncbi:MAG: glycosyltransferase [Fluviicola sp.]|nr:glycosyltransferase [Fluviicola sp.]MBP6271931.1 glycosyltransferase [Fluviicola sp.]
MLKTLLVVIGLSVGFASFGQIKRDVKGRILDQRTENPAEEVELTLTDKATGKIVETETDDEGNYVFKQITPGVYKLKITDRDYDSKTFDVNVDADHTSDYNMSDFTIGLKVSWLFNWGDWGNKEHYWSHVLAKIILVIYAACIILVFIYSLIQLSLSIAYAKNRKKKAAAVHPVFNPETAQKVTIQLPMFNEMYVSDRIIEAIANFDYPRDKFDIQVLDDSTDETKDLIAKKVAEVAARGIQIEHIHRVDRTGYKAGALDAAMDKVKGDFIAIFDADFVPEPDFLQKTMPHFDSDEIGVVQTRWGHLNKSYSLLTELQAFGLNGHFAAEQGGRNASGHFINFNGTGGIWRKKCIESAGGWEHDTLTEDLDLSYRAQLRGWKFRYLEHVVAPAELPITMSALKAQQHRWMKGGAECFVKMWRTILTFENVKLSDRIHGMAHLFNSTVFVFILIMSIMSLGILHIKDSFSDLNYIIRYGVVFISSTVFLMYYYWLAYRDKTENTFKSFIRFVGRFFQFLVVSLGLSLSNTVAVLEGYLGIKSSFVRTPKFNVNKKTEFKGNKYDKKSISIITIGEGLLMVVFGFTAINRAIYGDLGMVPFHLMLSIGYGLVFFNTLKELRTA